MRVMFVSDTLAANVNVYIHNTHQTIHSHIHMHEYVFSGTATLSWVILIVQEGGLSWLLVWKRYGYVYVTIWVYVLLMDVYVM